MSKILANQIANYLDNAPIEIKEGLSIPIGKPIQIDGNAGTLGQVLTSTGTSIEWTTPFSGSYIDLTNKPIIPAAQVRADWNAVGTVSEILNKPIIPPQSSLVVNAAGTPSLTYNSVNGQFTYTPPDLSGYLRIDDDSIPSPVSISDTAPPDPTSGDLWWNSSSAILKVFYDDGNTTQWIDATSVPTASYISDTAPPDPTSGDLWWNSSSAILKVFYDDGNTTQWIDATSVPTASYISDTAPPDPTPGDLWWNSSSAILKVFYDDGNTTQWIDATSVPTASYISDTAPPDPTPGDLWWNSSNAILQVFYDDGNTTQWIDATSVPTASYISDTAPPDPTPGDLWWNSSNAILQVFYDDGNSSQWIDATSVPKPVFISDTAPLDPTPGNLWWNSSNAILQVFYDDGNSSQWIDATSVPKPVFISDTAPLDPTPGNLWWNSSNARLKVFYDDGSSSQWVDASPVDGVGITLTDLSVTTNAAGTAALSYNNISGVFTYTPPDLSAYLTSYTETDPVFSISPAASISTTQINNWDTAYGWGAGTATNVPVAVGCINMNGFSPTWTGTTGYTVTGTQPQGSGTDYVYTLTFPSAYSARTDYIVQATFDGTNYVPENGCELAVARGTASVVFTPRRFDGQPLNQGEIMVTITNL